jgi:hypothetical protein
MAADKVLNDLARRYIEKLPPVRENTLSFFFIFFCLLFKEHC